MGVPEWDAFFEREWANLNAAAPTTCEDGNMKVKLNAAARLKAAGMNMVETIADSFEGWINTLGWLYVRDDEAEKPTVTVDASYEEVTKKLVADGWVRNRGVAPDYFKGDHAVILQKAGERQTKIISYK